MSTQSFGLSKKTKTNLKPVLQQLVKVGRIEKYFEGYCIIDLEEKSGCDKISHKAHVGASLDLSAFLITQIL